MTLVLTYLTGVTSWAQYGYVSRYTWTRGKLSVDTSGPPPILFGP